jgi:hypothetical protein
VFIEHGMFMNHVKSFSLPLSLLTAPTIALTAALSVFFTAAVFAATEVEISAASVISQEESILDLDQFRSGEAIYADSSHPEALDKDVTWERGDSLAPLFLPAYLNGGTYTEGWDFVFDFDDGIIISAQIVISNFGSGNHRMLVLVKLTDPSGREVTLKNGRGRSDWFKHEDEFDYQIAQHHFWKDGDTFYFRFSHPSGDINLVAESITEPLNLGIVWSGAKVGYQYVNIFAPRMMVSGQYRIKDEDSGIVQAYQTLGHGVGHGIRHITSSAMGEASRAWLRAFASGSSSNNELSPVIDMRQLKNGRTKANVRLLDATGSVIDDLSFETESSLLKDSRADCCSVIALNAAGTGNLDGTISLDKQVQQFDVVDELKPFERFFVRMFKTPISTRFRLSYDLTYTANGTSVHLIGQGLADLMTLK